MLACLQPCPQPTTRRQPHVQTFSCRRRSSTCNMCSALHLEEGRAATPQVVRHSLHSSSADGSKEHDQDSFGQACLYLWAIYYAFNFSSLEIYLGIYSDLQERPPASWQATNVPQCPNDPRPFADRVRVESRLLHPRHSPWPRHSLPRRGLVRAGDLGEPIR